MFDAESVKYADNPEAYSERLQAKLQPERIRATLAFSGLYQLTHQLIQNAVVDQVRGFFGESPLDDTWLFGREDYEWEVQRRHKNAVQGISTLAVEDGGGQC